MTKYRVLITEVERQILMDALNLGIEQDFWTDRIEDAAASALYERLNLLPENGT